MNMKVQSITVLALLVSILSARACGQRGANRDRHAESRSV